MEKTAIWRFPFKFRNINDTSLTADCQQCRANTQLAAPWRPGFRAGVLPSSAVAAKSGRSPPRSRCRRRKAACRYRSFPCPEWPRPLPRRHSRTRTGRRPRPMGDRAWHDRAVHPGELVGRELQILEEIALLLVRFDRLAAVGAFRPELDGLVAHGSLRRRAMKNPSVPSRWGSVWTWPIRSVASSQTGSRGGSGSAVRPETWSGPSA